MEYLVRIKKRKLIKLITIFVRLNITIISECFTFKIHIPSIQFSKINCIYRSYLYIFEYIGRKYVTL